MDVDSSRDELSGGELIVICPVRHNAGGSLFQVPRGLTSAHYQSSIHLIDGSSCCHLLRLSLCCHRLMSCCRPSFDASSHRMLLLFFLTRFLSLFISRRTCDNLSFPTLTSATYQQGWVYPPFSRKRELFACSSRYQRDEPLRAQHPTVYQLESQY